MKEKEVDFSLRRGFRCVDVIPDYFPMIHTRKWLVTDKGSARPTCAPPLCTAVLHRARMTSKTQPYSLYVYSKPPLWHKQQQRCVTEGWGSVSLLTVSMNTDPCLPFQSVQTWSKVREKSEADNDFKNVRHYKMNILLLKDNISWVWGFYFISKVIIRSPCF